MSRRPLNTDPGNAVTMPKPTRFLPVPRAEIVNMLNQLGGAEMLLGALTMSFGLEEPPALLAEIVDAVTSSAEPVTITVETSTSVVVASVE